MRRAIYLVGKITASEAFQRQLRCANVEHPIDPEKTPIHSNRPHREEGLNRGQVDGGYIRAFEADELGRACQRKGETAKSRRRSELIHLKVRSSKLLS